MVAEGNDNPQLTTPSLACSQTLLDLSKNTMADSVYIAFRTAQLISSFRRRIKTRVLSNATARASTARLQDGLRDEFEKEALDVITKRRNRPHPAHRNKGDAGSEAAQPPQFIGNPGLGQHPEAADKSKPFKSVFWPAEKLLTELNSKLSRKGCSVLDLAANNKLFLSSWYEIDFSGGVSKITELLALIERLLNPLNAVFSQCSTKDKVICEGTEVVLDSTFAPNLEHILLCLQNDLWRFLLMETALVHLFKHIIECQKEQSRRRKIWCSEFPGVKPPLSTTWPWCIRPSLVVLWGVCWMFYYEWDAAGNIRTMSGKIVISLQELLGLFDRCKHSRTCGECSRCSLTRSEGHRKLIKGADENNNPQANVNSRLSPDNARHHQPQRRELGLIDIWPTGHGINGNAGPTPPHASYVYVDEYGDASTSYGPPSSATSTVGLATGISNYDNTRLEPQRQQALSLSSSLGTNSFSYIDQWIPIITLPEDYISTPQQNNSLAPSYSPHSMTEPIETAGSARDREPSASPEKDSVISDGTESQDGESMKHEERDHDLTASPTSLHPPQRNRIRSDPKLTDDGKFACAICHQLFERRCEWNKHMDKHERPYKCDKPQCAKLLGFTYTGGLLRHQREVHSMHGGPREQLFCPFSQCKRHSEQGFTRKENLHEHLRRVHKQADPNTLRSDVVEDAPTPVSRTSDNSDWTTVLSAKPDSKRKRSITIQNDESAEDGLEQEIKRLRGENGELKRMYESQQDQMTEMKRQMEQILRLQQKQQGVDPTE